MSLRRGFNPLAAFAPIAAGLRATAFRRVRIGTRDHRPILPFALLLMAAALVPLPGRTQESSAPPAESTETPKPEANQSAPAPAAPTPAAPTPDAAPPGAVRVPEVVVTPPKPKRVSQEPRPRAIAAAQPP